MGEIHRYAILLLFIIAGTACNTKDIIDIREQEYERVIAAAELCLDEEPVTITAFICERSQGGIHDFYSEGDYWWPDPQNPDGPHIRRDGMSNPDNFTAHRITMRDMNIWVPALVAAYELTGDQEQKAFCREHFKKHILPVRGSALLFAGIHYDDPDYIHTWLSLPAESEVQEALRTFVIRQPVLWID